MTEAYRLGFLTKCAERGVGPHEAKRLMKLAAMPSDGGSRLADDMHDGMVNVARVGMNLAKPFAWLGDRAAGMFGANPNLSGRLDSAKPEYRDASLETNPWNSATVDFATGGTGAALVAAAGLPSLASRAAAYIGAGAMSPAVASAAYASVPVINTAGAAATVAAPFVSGFNSYHDQVRANSRAGELRRFRANHGDGASFITSGDESAFDRARHGVGTAVNWIGGNDPYYLADNLRSIQ